MNRIRWASNRQSQHIKIPASPRFRTPKWGNLGRQIWWSENIVKTTVLNKAPNRTEMMVATSLRLTIAQWKLILPKTTFHINRRFLNHGIVKRVAQTSRISFLQKIWRNNKRVWKVRGRRSRGKVNRRSAPRRATTRTVQLRRRWWKIPRITVVPIGTTSICRRAMPVAKTSPSTTKTK